MQPLSIKFWDVQHGNATHITTPNGRTIVIDLGDADSITGTGARFSPLLSLRYTGGVTVIDDLIITHPHRDHIDDIDNLRLFEVGALYRPNWLSEDQIRRGNKPQDGSKITEYIALNNRFTLPLAPPNDLEKPSDWGGAIIKIFTSPEVSGDNLNNHSIVTFVSYAGLKALLPGDNESTSWKELLKQPSFVSELLGVHVLLAPHHGREAGFCQELFDAGLSPWVTIISDDQHGSTSVTDKYHARTSGWQVEKPDGTLEKRRCVTTRCDGHIVVTFGYEGTGNFLNIKIQR